MKNNLIFAIVIITLAIPWCWTKTIKDDFSSERAKIILQLAKSAEIKAFLNNKIDPCNDFYSFSCGTWKNNYPAQMFGDLNTDKFDALSRGIEQKFNNLLQQEKDGDEGNLENKIKDFYQSCRNTKTDNIQYSLALENVYKEFGQFSFLKTEDQLTKSDFQWWTIVAKIQNIYGKSILLEVKVLNDFKNKSKTMLYLGNAGFDLIFSGKNIIHIQESKIKIHLKSYFGIENDQSSKISKELIEFEQSLAVASNGVKQKQSIEDILTLYNTNDLKEIYKDLFDVENFLEIVLGTKDIPEQIYIYDESYLKNLMDVFNKTEQRIIENYILWQLFEEYIVDAQDFDLNKVCSAKTKKYFGKFINHVLYNQYRTKEGELEIFELWDDIKTVFRQDLNSEKYYWMSIATREHAIEKLNNMNLTINSYDNYNFVEFFKNLDIDATNYVVNLQNIFKHSEALRENKLLKKPQGIEDDLEMSFTPSYNIFTNQIKIPIALLQPHYIWDPNYPKAIQYATLGYLIAHEMIHGFDDEGRNYDANGNARLWWDEKTTYEFESRRKCFQAQYHNYTYGGRRLPESIVQTENIADNAGLKLAYSAYRRWLAKPKEVASDKEAIDILPRLNFNNLELFFISFAQLSCEDTQSFFRSSFASNDIHAPAMFRVIGSLSNFREFAWIWKCKEESPMDPSNKCEIY